VSFLNPVFEAMGTVLSWFYEIVPNYGVAIILLTVVVRLVLYPLTAKQARSMIAMQRVQPEIKKLQAKYKDDRQKLNEEMMKFYKENKINPFGGCLPLLAQMPIFIALFQVLNDPEKHVPTDSAFFRDMCSGADCASQSMPFLGMDLSLSAGSGQHGSFVDALPYWILIAAVAITAYLQQRQTMRRNPGANAQAQMIGRIMPVVFAFISINLPAGVVLYFLVSNLWQMGQQELIIRRMDQEPAPAAGGKAGAIDAKSTDAKEGVKGTAASTGGGGLFARLTRAVGAGPAPTEGEAARAGADDGNGARSSGGAASSPGSKGAGSQGGAAKATGSAAGRSGGGAKAGNGRSGGSGKSGQSSRRRSNKKRRR
jgi:YidC/Oxa1 family membrane protein insertase